MPQGSAEAMLKELRTLSCRQFHRGTDYMIVCPFHDDVNPSLGVNLSHLSGVGVGIYYCFGCGAKGHWNSLAKKLGIRLMDTDGIQPESTSELVKGFAERKSRLLGEDVEIMPNGLVPFYDKSWRGISKESVVEAGGMLAWDERAKETFLWLPAMVEGCMEFALKARLRKTKNKPSYLYHDPRHVKEKSWWGLDLASDMLSKGRARNSVFLVEGARDALRLVDAGLSALALLSTSQWNSRKKTQLVSLCMEHSADPVVMMDSDAAGIKAQKRMASDLQDTGLDVKEIKLAVHARKMGLRDLDPADLDDGFCDKLRKHMG